MITAVIFDGKKYDLWERAARTALKSKNKLGFIDAGFTKPTPKEGEDTSELQAWEMVNSMIYSWILNVIEPKLKSSIAFVDTARALWKNLEQCYAVTNIPKVHRLKVSVVECKQGGMDIVDYYARSIELWSELQN